MVYCDSKSCVYWLLQVFGSGQLPLLSFFPWLQCNFSLQTSHKLNNVSHGQLFIYLFYQYLPTLPHSNEKLINFTIWCFGACWLLRKVRPGLHTGHHTCIFLAMNLILMIVFPCLPDWDGIKQYVCPYSIFNTPLESQPKKTNNYLKWAKQILLFAGTV